MKTCIKCKVEYEKTSTFFPYRNKLKGWLSSWCKYCHVKHKNDNDVKERQLFNQRVRRRAKSVCHKCGTSDRSLGTRYCLLCAKLIKSEQKRYDKAIYKSRLKESTPLWANKFYIKEIYHLARLRTKMLGINFHVDHIIPLRGKNVCGLHVENNLRIIDKVTNQIKSNHYSFEHEGMK